MIYRFLNFWKGFPRQSIYCIPDMLAGHVNIAIIARTCTNKIAVIFDFLSLNTERIKGNFSISRNHKTIKAFETSN